MKTTSKKIITSGIIAPTLVLFTASAAMAINQPTNTGSLKSTVCSRIENLQGTNESTVAKHMATLQTNFAARLAKITSNKTENDQKVLTARTNARNQFEEKIKTMESQEGITDVQKEAIETFKTNMEQAKDTRDAAVDNARTKYRTALMKTVSTQQQGLVDASNAYQTSVKSAFQTATANCGDEKTVMTNLRAAIKTTRQTMKDARSASKATNEVKQFAATRNAAIQTANKTFADSAAKYASTLSAALETTN